MRFSIALAALAATLVAAHPGHDHAAEQAIRRDFLAHQQRGLGHCADKLAARGVTSRSAARRTAVADELRERRGIKKRGEHESDADYTINTDPAVIFEEDTSCILSPEVTEGPYYVAGEYVRLDVTEDQPGVGLFTDIQVIDTESCEPIVGAYLEIWHCNSTGVYGGVVSGGNGNQDDESNLDATWLRGVQQTDVDGVVQFQTVFPGHYTGRTTHVHVMVHINSQEPFDNGTLIDTTATHVGQFFFDQDLISSVEETSPYSTNTQPLTTNDEDGILQEESTSGDPIIKYVVLGDTVEEGLLGWLSFGVNTTYTRTVSAAATYYEGGGVANPGGGGGGPPPS